MAQDPLTISTATGQGAAQVLQPANSGGWGMQMAQQWRHNRQVAAQEEANKLHAATLEKDKRDREFGDVQAMIKPVADILPAHQGIMNKMSTGIYDYVQKNYNNLTNPVVRTEINKMLNEYYSFGNASKSLYKQVDSVRDNIVNKGHVTNDNTAEQLLNSKYDPYKNLTTPEQAGEQLAKDQEAVNAYSSFAPLDSTKELDHYQNEREKQARSRGDITEFTDAQGNYHKKGVISTSLPEAEKIVSNALTDPNKFNQINYAYNQELKKDPKLQDTYKDASDWWIKTKAPLLVGTQYHGVTKVEKEDAEKKAKQYTYSNGTLSNNTYSFIPGNKQGTLINDPAQELKEGKSGSAVKGNISVDTPTVTVTNSKEGDNKNWEISTNMVIDPTTRKPSQNTGNITSTINSIDYIDVDNNGKYEKQWVAVGKRRDQTEKGFVYTTQYYPLNQVKQKILAETGASEADFDKTLREAVPNSVIPKIKSGGGTKEQPKSAENKPAEQSKETKIFDTRNHTYGGVKISNQGYNPKSNRTQLILENGEKILLDGDQRIK